jgi:REP element-mobilizing transposase RayT
MPNFPMGYHITWDTYGSRLPGSPKPYVNRWNNEYGDDLPKPDPKREEAARDRMTQGPLKLTREQREEVERSLQGVAERYQWVIHQLASQSDHTHLVITAPRVGDELRDAPKAVACRALNKKFGKRTWWAKGGSCKYLWERDYFENAVGHVRDQRDF